MNYAEIIFNTFCTHLGKNNVYPVDKTKYVNLVCPDFSVSYSGIYYFIFVREGLHTKNQSEQNFLNYFRSIILNVIPENKFIMWDYNAKYANGVVKLQNKIDKYLENACFGTKQNL